MHALRLLLLIFSLAINAANASGLDDTGITTCGNASQNGLPCPVSGFPRQDAEYGPNTFSFTKLDAAGNPLPDTATNQVCVFDGHTGLVWEVKTDDGGLRDKDNTYTFDSAAAFATAVNTAGGLCGFTDWRVPNPQELAGLGDLSIPYPGPAISTSYFPNTVGAYFWTNSFYLGDSSKAWFVAFNYGSYFDTDTRTVGHAVRLVHGAQVGASFHANGDGTVTDATTGLMWSQCALGQSGSSCSGSQSTMNWGQALTAATNSTLAGYNDWRVPNAKELHSLVKYSAYNPSIDTAYFPNTSYYMWSSSSNANDSSIAWVVYFGSGFVGNGGRASYSAVRLVRGGQWLFSFFLLHVNKAGSGSGTVTSTPAGISCGTVCTGSYASGAVIALAAATPASAVFSGWGGACSGNAATCTVTMDAAKNVTATFSRIVTTSSATSITTTSAVLNGTVNDAGVTTTASFDFGPTTSYGTSITASPSQIAAGTGDTAVTTNRKSLACNTVYHYRVKAVNSLGTFYGADKSFTTSMCPPGLPIATTNTASAITSTGATLNATVNDNYANTTVIFEYGPTNSYGSTITAIPGTIMSTTGATAVTANLTNLTQNTGYHYRVKAVNSVGTGYGLDQAFTTPSETFPPAGQLPSSWTAPTSSNANWTVASDFIHTGQYSLKSGVITDNQKSQVQINSDFQAGQVAFTLRVSSEAGYDFLRFYVDGVQQGEWSGENPWVGVSYPITAGNHTLLWSYEKDDSNSAGSDAAWIDDVVLPAALNSNYSVTIAKTGNGSGTISGGGTFLSGTTVTLIATPDANSTFTGWNPSPCAASFTMPSNNLTCTATFSLKTYTVTPSANAGGTISPSTAQTVDYGATKQFTVTPNSNYTATVTGTCGGTLTNNTYVTNPITADCSVIASFAPACTAAWTAQTTPTTSTLSSLVWSGSNFLAVGTSGTAITSPEGVVWNNGNVGAANVLNSVAWSGTQFVAVSGVLDKSLIYTSPDGITWTEHVSTGNPVLRGVVWNGTISKLIAVGEQGAILSSGPDATTWTVAQTGKAYVLNAITSTGTLQVAVGTGSTILTSPDGITWTQRSAPVQSVNLRTVIWNGSQFIAAGDKPMVFSSSDGTTWTVNSTPASLDFYNIEWNGSKYVAVGSTAIATSPDGISWTVVSTQTNALRDISWSGTELVAVGDNGTVLRYCVPNQTDVVTAVSYDSANTPAAWPKDGVYIAGPRTTGVDYLVNAKVFSALTGGVIESGGQLSLSLNGTIAAYLFNSQVDLIFRSLQTGDVITAIYSGTDKYRRSTGSVTIGNTYALTVATNGAGTGTVTTNQTVTPDILCGAGGTDCSQQYATSNPAAVVTLIATAATGSSFSNWNGACSGTTTTCNVTMNAAKTVTATFNTNSTPTSYTVTPIINIGGTVTPNTPQTVTANTAKSFTVVPKTGYIKSPKGITGTCPLGHWGGNVWTTGNITANCAVNFDFFCLICMPDRGGWRAVVEH